ncbi:hypothetical protein SOVF_194550 [Spinacia oleracea]|nr:hypothetical protein SOVF_194550 [Spinacia oleracea]
MKQESSDISYFSNLRVLKLNASSSTRISLSALNRACF